MLNKTEVVTDSVVLVGVEACLLDIESLGAIHVRDGDRDQFDLPIHDFLLSSFSSFPRGPQAETPPVATPC
jgi:hypothetical protein